MVGALNLAQRREQHQQGAGQCSRTCPEKSNSAITSRAVGRDTALSTSYLFTPGITAST